MQRQKAVLSQIITFGIVGVITLLIDVGVTIVLYRVFNLPAYVSSGIGFLSGFFFNFPMNRKRVFRHTDNDRFSLHTQVTIYASLCIFNLVFTSSLTELIVNTGLIDIGYVKLLVTATIAIWNFLLFKFWIFSKN